LLAASKKGRAVCKAMLSWNKKKKGILLGNLYYLYRKAHVCVEEGTVLK
jgi:hypothetical protein